MKRSIIRSSADLNDQTESHALLPRHEFFSLDAGALNTIRVIAGCYAAEVVLTDWLIGFSMFLFLSLALVKRFTELRGVRIKNALLGGWLEVF